MTERLADGAGRMNTRWCGSSTALNGGPFSNMYITVGFLFSKITESFY